ncbi:MAG: crotonase/enoyl-CoA hydratase family protein [Casimicrobiaceae bacterium]|nr:crotonase/enoyl-CoA hydratase family protein [Casimicrobiaceae bacterium]
MLHCQLRDRILLVRLDRPEKRNALSDTLMRALAETLRTVPNEAAAVVIHGSGEHFCAGLDLAELRERDAAEGLAHSRLWHEVMNAIEFGRVPAIAALHGAVVGGGLELATACHLRVADASAYFALPEGSRGIFVGGGGSVRIARLIGASRMLDMMMTGRVYDAEAAERIGLVHYRVEAGQALERALALAERVAANAPLTNYALMHALPRIAEQPADHGLFTEALMSAIAQSAPEAKARLRDFLEGRAAKVERPQAPHSDS